MKMDGRGFRIRLPTVLAHYLPRSSFPPWLISSKMDGSIGRFFNCVRCTPTDAACDVRLGMSGPELLHTLSGSDPHAF